MDDQALRVKLLTSLNTRPMKRKRDDGAPARQSWHSIAKAAKPAPAASAAAQAALELPSAPEDGADGPSGRSRPHTDRADSLDAFKAHFAAETSLLSERTRKAVKDERWTTATRTIAELGEVTESMPEDAPASTHKGAVRHALSQ